MGPLESLKGKVISNSSFTLSNFLCVARNLEKKKSFLLRGKNDQICTTALYVLQLQSICQPTKICCRYS